MHRSKQRRDSIPSSAMASSIRGTSALPRGYRNRELAFSFSGIICSAI
jgi:hypothetical protein